MTSDNKDKEERSKTMANTNMKSWVVYNGGYLWAVRNTEEAAKALAARHNDAKVRGFLYGEGDKVTSKHYETLTIIRPAKSVTGAFGYMVKGAKHGDFIAEEDVVGLVSTTSWKEWFAHLVQVAVAIAEEKRDLTEAEYNAYEADGGGDMVDDFFDNLTAEDADNFVKWARGIAARVNGGR